MFRTAALTLALLLSTAIPFAHDRAEAGGGEDFPFFCRLDNEPDLHSFKVVSDLRMSTGYAMMLIRNGQVDGYFPVYVQDSDDGKWWVVWGSQYRYTLFRDRHVLAYINKETGQSSHEDVKTSLRNTSGRDWSLKPMRCGAAVP